MLTACFSYSPVTSENSGIIDPDALDHWYHQRSINADSERYLQRFTDRNENQNASNQAHGTVSTMPLIENISEGLSNGPFHICFCNANVAARLWLGRSTYHGSRVSCQVHSNTHHPWQNFKLLTTAAPGLCQRQRAG